MSISATAEQLRLSSIADRHLTKLETLPLKDRATVAITILGSVIMDHPECERMNLLQLAIEALLLHMETEDAGR